MIKTTISKTVSYLLIRFLDSENHRPDAITLNYTNLVLENSIQSFCVFIFQKYEI